MNTSKGWFDEKGLSLAGKGAAALAIGLGLGVCAARPVEAVIVHSSDFGFTPLTVLNSSQDIDIDNDGVNDFAIEHYQNTSILSYPGFAYIKQSGSTGMFGGIGNHRLTAGLSDTMGKGGPQYLYNFAEGESIGPQTVGTFGPVFGDGLLFQATSIHGYMNETQYDEIQGYGGFVQQSGYVGIILEDVVGMDVSYRYGWVNLLIPDDLSAIRIKGWAFDDSGDPIAAGEGAPVPIPGSLLLLASGAIGVIAMRRKKAKDAA